MAKVIGMGNALVDIMTRIDNDELLEMLELPKGSMQLVDTETSMRVSQATGSFSRSMAAGGSAANTIHGLAKLGVETAFIGSVGSDETGNFFITEMASNNVKPIMNQSDTPSGIAIALVSPDGERTFATHLGAAIELSPDHLNTKLFEGYSLFYVEGYLVQNEALLHKALELAKTAGLTVALDLSSYNVVEAKKEFLQAILEPFVDVVFANEEEALALTGTPPEEALGYLAQKCRIAVVKTGEKGSMVQSGNAVHQIAAIPSTPLDTTGAGDLYASGFLFGLLNEMPLERCGKIGSLLAGNVIRVVGAKMDEQHWVVLRQLIEKTE
jgi:sugar/nucleoside kinase (ribokinase family)